jgi:hypothetical protein
MPRCHVAAFLCRWCRESWARGSPLDVARASCAWAHGRDARATFQIRAADSDAESRYQAISSGGQLRPRSGRLKVAQRFGISIGCRVSGIGCRVLGLGFSVSGFRFRSVLRFSIFSSCFPPSASCLLLTAYCSLPFALAPLRFALCADVAHGY